MNFSELAQICFGQQIKLNARCFIIKHIILSHFKVKSCNDSSKLQISSNVMRIMEKDACASPFYQVC